MPFLFSPSPYQPGYVNGIGAHTLVYLIGADPRTSLVFASLEEATIFVIGSAKPRLQAENWQTR